MRLWSRLLLLLWSNFYVVCPPTRRSAGACCADVARVASVSPVSDRGRFRLRPWMNELLVSLAFEADACSRLPLSIAAPDSDRKVVSKRLSSAARTFHSSILQNLTMAATLWASDDEAKWEQHLDAIEQVAAQQSNFAASSRRIMRRPPRHRRDARSTACGADPSSARLAAPPRMRNDTHTGSA